MQHRYQESFTHILTFIFISSTDKTVSTYLFIIIMALLILLCRSFIQVNLILYLANCYFFTVLSKFTLSFYFILVSELFLLVLQMTNFFLCVRYSPPQSLFLPVLHMVDFFSRSSNCIFLMSVVMAHSYPELFLFSYFCVSPRQNISSWGKEICRFVSCCRYKDQCSIWQLYKLMILLRSTSLFVFSSDR